MQAAGEFKPFLIFLKPIWQHREKERNLVAAGVREKDAADGNDQHEEIEEGVQKDGFEPALGAFGAAFAVFPTEDLEEDKNSRQQQAQYQDPH